MTKPEMLQEISTIRSEMAILWKFFHAQSTALKALFTLAANLCRSESDLKALKAWSEIYLPPAEKQGGTEMIQ